MHLNETEVKILTMNKHFHRDMVLLLLLIHVDVK